jgi:hypothetical protein
MSKLQTKHWAVIGAQLIAVGAQLAGLAHGWHDALTPAFIGGLIGQLGVTVTAIFVGAPRDPDERGRATDRRSYSQGAQS